MKSRETLSRRLRRVNRFALLAAMGLLALGVIAASFTLGLMNVIDASRVQARVLSENLSAALLFQDHEGAMDVLRSVRVAPGVESATLLTNDGESFSSWRRDETVRFGLLDPITLVEVKQPVRTAAGSRVLGSLLLSIDLTQLYVRTGVLGLASLVALLLSLAVSELWLRRLNASVLLPLQALSELMRRVSSGSGYDLRAAESELAEVNELGQGLNAMLVAIGERDERLVVQRERLERLAYSDSLTGLANREAFRDLVHENLAHAARAGLRLSILFMDLDGFKDINDSLGHTTGDRLLQAAATRLQQNVPAAKAGRVHLARFGGDEFTALLVGAGPDDALVAARAIAAQMRRPFFVDDRELRVTASIGIAHYPDHGTDAATLLKHADTAMYHAKSQGRDNVQFYHPTLTQQAIDRMTLERDLRAALELGQFHLVYQPQLDTRSGRIESVEALIRWMHPERGLIPPADFIPLAERNGLIVPIGEFVLRAACHAASDWHRAGLAVRVAVNLSPVQLHHPGLAELVADALRGSALPAQFLELEMTETALMENSAMALNTLRALRATGVRLALDDFGTGFSSMSYLHRLPLNTIKVDRSFVQGLPADRDSHSIVSAIVSMAHSLALDVTAEGVETAEQALLLSEMKCQSLQGWYIGRPMAVTDVAALLRRQDARAGHGRLLSTGAGFAG